MFMIDILLLILYININNEHILIGTMLRPLLLLVKPPLANKTKNIVKNWIYADICAQ